MSFKLDYFKLHQSFYPQVLALACGRICRSSSSTEYLDSIIKASEVVTRYLAALAVSSFNARRNKNEKLPEIRKSLTGKLGFGDFLTVLQCISSSKGNHPLKKEFEKSFNGKKAIANNALINLLSLRNKLGHDLMGLSEVKASSILKEYQPEDQLLMVLDVVNGLLELPLFLLENQSYQQKTFTGRRLLLMGESDPIPDEVELQPGLNKTSELYVAINDGVLSLSPLLIWDVVKRKMDYGIYLIHGSTNSDVQFINVYDDKKNKNGPLIKELYDCLEGNQETKEDVLLKDGTSLLNDWKNKKKNFKFSYSEKPIPWDELDQEILSWYCKLLTGGKVEEKEIIQERLLDGREIISEVETHQIVFLFGKEKIVRRQLRRNMIDCRAKKDKNSSKRWDERKEFCSNILSCLRETIDFFGRHTGIDGVTIDGLKATSGSADYIAIREGLVNLFIHQDYSDPGVVGQIEITKDRSIFHNAGKSLVNSASLVDGGRSQSRNPLISRALKMIGFAELAGSGLREVHRLWRNEKRRPPKFESNESSNTFTLTLDWRPLPEDIDEFWRKKLGVKITSEQAGILSLLCEPNGFTLEEIASAKGILIDDTRLALDEMMKKGLIQLDQSKYFILEHLKQLAESKP
ncbi:MAG: hypothetical protein HOB18_00845 [Nitrospina sp.]|nr:hypothetical protein [Nitrospina sp.]